MSSIEHIVSQGGFYVVATPAGLALLHGQTQQAVEELFWKKIEGESYGPPHARSTYRREDVRAHPATATELRSWARYSTASSVADSMYAAAEIRAALNRLHAMMAEQEAEEAEQPGHKPNI